MSSKNELAGTMDREIVIQERVTTENTYAEKIETWQDVLSVWANVSYPNTKSDETVDGVLLIATSFAYFTIRYLDFVTTLNRICWNSQIWDIKTLAYPDRNKTIVLGCELVL